MEAVAKSKMTLSGHFGWPRMIGDLLAQSGQRLTVGIGPTVAHRLRTNEPPLCRTLTDDSYGFLRGPTFVFRFCADLAKL